MMSNIIGEQHVARRKKPSLLYKALDYRQPGSGTDFIREIKQKPIPARRRKKRKTPGFLFFRLPKIRLREIFHFRKGYFTPGNFGKKVPQRKERRASGQEPKIRARRSGFSFPIPSLASLAVITGTLLVSLLVLNWEGLGFSLSSQSYLPEPGPDEEGRRNLASYAGIPLTETPAAAEIPLDLMETFTWTSYTVKRGDSVSKIAADNAISMDAIIASNNIRNARRLREGEVLRIPNMDGIPYTIKKDDSLSKISKSMGVPPEAILDANDLRSDTLILGQQIFIPGAKMRRDDLRLALGELLIYPIRGRLTSPFGWRSDPISGVRRYHAAIDLAASLGTTVKAAMDGRVSTLGNNATYGKFIILSHDGGYQTMYAHLSLISVKEGDRVIQEGKIGEVGNTGYSTGPHLHFAVYKNGKPVNPLDFLN
ncbi:MAG: M23 family metallopeptidase [Treponema sp.]|jgi:murein DD-endopeptidase MepM/ murein hydrolase activator NlpD|nr:M23 family metallopeptidase [Treponema sp.]